MPDEKLYTKCPHCGRDASDVAENNGICWFCGKDITVFPACPEPFTQHTPNVMTPDGRREVAITMLDNLYSARTAIGYRMGCTSLSIPADKTREQWIEEAQNDYIAIQEQILELMGVDS
ncbi:MAG TPA: hypothetical protein VIY48_21960 [Candidatus Paceibacterota bacterium]